LKIERWITVNISFNETERKEADKIIRRYLKNGYDDNGEDDGVDYEVCYQVVGRVISKELPKR